MVKTLNNLDKSAFEKLKKEGKRILFFRELPIESIDPLRVYKLLFKPNEPSFIFEVNHDNETKHFTNLGFQPLATFRCKDGNVELYDVRSKSRKKVQENPYDELRKFMRQYSPSKEAVYPPFADGMFGYMGYDSVRLIEKLPDNHPNTSDLPEILFTFFGKMLIFNHLHGILNLILSIDPSIDYETANNQMDQFEGEISGILPTIQLSSQSKETHIEVDIEDSIYKDLVLKAKERIYQGEIFQIVISRTFSMPVTADPIDIYANLTHINPSPYMYLYNDVDYVIVGASPEKLITVFENYVETVAVGGTHAKEEGKKDAVVAKELLADKKEVAEHNMKMEVGRNDIGAVATPGTVVIQELRGTRAFSHVIHIITRVGGTLRPDKDGIDAITSILPAATLSGCPKIPAMRIIDELENDRRGLYGGAMCFLDCRGNVVSCITIRTILIKNGRAYVRAGAGVVTYSEPDYEAKETRHKAQGSFKALKLAEGKHL